MEAVEVSIDDSQGNNRTWLVAKLGGGLSADPWFTNGTPPPLLMADPRVFFSIDKAIDMHISYLILINFNNIFHCAISSILTIS